MPGEGQKNDAIPVSQPFALGANNQGINTADPLIIDFLTDAFNISFYVIDVENDALTLLFYDVNGTLLERINVASQGGSGLNTRIQSLAERVRRVEVTNGDGIAFDNLSYDIKCDH